MEPEHKPQIDIKIINLKVDSLIERYKKRIKVKIDKNILSDILSMCDYRVYGARKIDKIIKDKIENQIIDSLIDGKNEVYINNILQLI